MAKQPFVGDILFFHDDGRTVTVNGVGKPKTIELPGEVVEWLRGSYAAKTILRELITHHRFRMRLAHPGALRSLILLLYARGTNSPPYKVARRFGVAPEQLYRIERGLRKDNLHEFVMNLLVVEMAEKLAVAEGGKNARQA